MQGMQKLHLQLSGFSISEANNFHSIYALAEGRLDQLWLLSDHAGGDVLIVRDKSQLPQLPVPCIYCCPVGTPLPQRSGNVWPLPVDANHVPLLSHLVRVLSEIADYLAQPPQDMAATQVQNDQLEASQADCSEARPGEGHSIEAPSEEAPSEEIETVEAPSAVIQPEMQSDTPPPPELGLPVGDATAPAATRQATKEQVIGLLQALEVLAGEKESILIRYATGEQVYVALGPEQYLLDLSMEELGRCLEQRVAFDILPCSEADYPAAAKPEPLAHLRWFIALKSTVLHGSERLSGKTVRLRRWPNMGLPGCQPLLRLAAFMQSNEASLATITAKTGMTEKQVCAFITACEQEGLVLFGEGGEEIFEKQIDSNLRSLLSQISRRIND